MDTLVGDRAGYGTSEICLTYDLLSKIWDLIINEALLKNERDIVYKWLKESVEYKGGFPMSIDDLIKFFQEKMTDTKDCKNMTIDGFNCFKNIFLLINEKMNNITKISSSSVNLDLYHINSLF